MLGKRGDKFPGANLKSIYDGLRAWQDETGNSPEESGVRFFGQLIASGFWEDTEEMRRTLTCPGANVPLVENMPSFADLEAITGDHSAYAGRDNANHPLPRFPTSGEEPLIACDNAHGMNHAGVLNVL
ncbi:MAG: hypothetical protein IH891_07635, partial [Planctomycetes bacterium]|nr:hypothetical protein [Planctomycetota bacterium]